MKYKIVAGVCRIRISLRARRKPNSALLLDFSTNTNRTNLHSKWMLTYFLRPLPNSSEWEPKRTSSIISCSLSKHINRVSLSI